MTTNLIIVVLVSR